MEFTERDEIIDENHPSLEYRRRRDDEKTCVSYGQRKLLLSLVSFLSQHCRSIDKVIILYVGAAPGNNISIAIDLFPGFEWHLYDPARFALRTDVSKKVFVYQKYFEDDTAKYWSERKERNNENIIFISDIRTADYTKTKDLDENEDQIELDMAMQRKWVEIIRPVVCQLKFRLSYSLEGRNNMFEYFDGLLYLQAFAPQTSTECRLVFKEIKYKMYDCKKNEEQMFYHNAVVREKNRYENEVADGIELVDDWDSSCEVHIWKMFLGENWTKEEVLKLSRETTTLLNKDKKIPDTLSYLRANPRIIKNRNFEKSKKKKKFKEKREEK